MAGNTDKVINDIKAFSKPSETAASARTEQDSGTHDSSNNRVEAPSIEDGASNMDSNSVDAPTNQPNEANFEERTVTELDTGFTERTASVASDSMNVVEDAITYEEERNVGPTLDDTGPQNGNDVQALQASSKPTEHALREAGTLSEAMRNTNQSGKALVGKTDVVGKVEANSDETMNAEVPLMATHPTSLLPVRSRFIPPPNFPTKAETSYDRNLAETKGDAATAEQNKEELEGTSEKASISDNEKEKQDRIAFNSRVTSIPQEIGNVDDGKRPGVPGTGMDFSSKLFDTTSGSTLGIPPRSSSGSDKPKPQSIGDANNVTARQEQNSQSGDTKRNDADKQMPIKNSSRKHASVTRKRFPELFPSNPPLRIAANALNQMHGACMTPPSAKRVKISDECGPRQRFDKRNPADSETDATHRPLPNAQSSNNLILVRDQAQASRELLDDSQTLSDQMPIPSPPEAKKKYDECAAAMKVDVVSEYHEKPRNVKVEAESEIQPRQDNSPPAVEICQTCGHRVEPDHDCQGNIEKVFYNPRTF